MSEYNWGKHKNRELVHGPYDNNFFNTKKFQDGNEDFQEGGIENRSLKRKRASNTGNPVDDDIGE